MSIGMLASAAACAELGAAGALYEDERAAEVGLPAPVLADAGPDRDVLRGYPSYLDARGTHHPFGHSYTVWWTQLEGERVYLSNPGALTPSFVAPLEPQILVFELVAEDGVWQTSDQVTLRVRERPTAVAPLARAGSDRAADDLLSSAIGDADVVEVSSGAALRWETIEPLALRVGSQPRRDVEIPFIHRLTSERDGLSSAPDYLLIWPPGSMPVGSVAPLASLIAPSFVAPGGDVALDAAGSTDANGDPIRFRWQQTRGDPVLPDAASESRVSTHATARPQELVFRVFVRDRYLESAPASAAVAVGPGLLGEIPTLCPGADKATRPGRMVTLDAMEGDTSHDELEGSEAVTYRWIQTMGTPVALAPSEPTGKSASFVAPAEPQQLAFAVTALRGELESAPAVVTVSILSDDVNAAPAISLEATPAAPVSGELVTVTATIDDPEGDPAVDCVWSLNTEATVVLESSTCTAERASASFVAPSSGSDLDIELRVEDELGASATATLPLSVR